MGIQGLLPFVKEATKNVNLNDLRGRTVAVDSYCWLHRGIIGCADKIIKGEDTDVYVHYCFKYIDLLLSHKITPIMVFDGQNLAAKAGTEDKRRESRAQAKKRAIEAMKLNKMGEAKKNFIQAVDITPKIALKLIQACRARKIDCIVAPYEADAQLAFLNLNGYVDFIISEDSDLLVFGCLRVLFKLDAQGNGMLVERDKLFISMREKPETFSIDKFRYMCIISGCDYLDSLPGIGLKKAQKFINTISNQNIYDALPKIPRCLNLKNIVVTKEYRDNFMIADATFKHQLIFDPMKRKLTYLTDPNESGTNPEYLCNAGEIIDNDIAFQLAIGNRSPANLSVLDDWNPDSESYLNTFRVSVWSKNYQLPKKTTMSLISPTKSNKFPSTRDKNVVLNVKPIDNSLRLLRTPTEEENREEERIKRDMEKMYFTESDDEPSSKRPCLNSSQKENDSEPNSPVINSRNSNSPVLNRSRNIFAKKSYCFGDDSDGSDDDFQTIKRKSDTESMTERIKRNKSNVFVNDKNSVIESCVKTENIKGNDDENSDFKQSPIKESNKFTMKNVKESFMKSFQKSPKSSIKEVMKNKSEESTNINVKTPEITTEFQDEATNSMSQCSSQENDLINIKESQESLTNDIYNCHIAQIIGVNIEKTVTKSKIFTKEPIKIQTKNVQIESQTVVNKQIPKPGVCRRPGLSRKKTIVPKNQTTLSHFFKSE